jgi:hypothetical protein
MAVSSESGKRTPETQLRSFIDRLEQKNRKLFRLVRAALRKRFPTANELVYDYPDSVVIAYSPTDRGIDGIVSIAARTDGVRLYLMNGPKLPDPKGLLLGTGTQVRFVRVEAAGQLAHPDVVALIAATVERARVPFPSGGKGGLIIRSAARKQRPSRTPLRRAPAAAPTRDQ